MKLSLISLLVSFTIIAQSFSETIKCKVVPFETKDGVSGTCCVIFRNSSAVFPHEEVKKQILINKEENGKKPDDDKLVFMDGHHKEKENKSNVTISTKNAFDTPSGCPPGKMKDHSGGCTEPF